MLVITRRLGEEIVIDGRIVVSVENVGPGMRATLGIKAPREITVDRREVHEMRKAMAATCHRCQHEHDEMACPNCGTRRAMA